MNDFWYLLYIKKKLVRNIIKNKQTKIKKTIYLIKKQCILCILGKASKKTESSEINAKIELQ